MKARRLEEGSSQVPGNIPPTLREGSTQKFPEDKAPTPPTILWSDTSFDDIQFIGSHIPFSEEFHGDYKALKSTPPLSLISINDNLLLKVLMLEDVDRKRKNQVDKEMTVNLWKYMDVITIK